MLHYVEVTNYKVTNYKGAGGPRLTFGIDEHLESIRGYLQV